MNARAADLALSLTPSTDTFGLPACDVVLIAKLRNLPAELLAAITGKDAA
jgi:hypothetical protein